MQILYGCKMLLIHQFKPWTSKPNNKKARLIECQWNITIFRAPSPLIEQLKKQTIWPRSWFDEPRCGSRLKISFRLIRCKNKLRIATVAIIAEESSSRLSLEPEENASAHAANHVSEVCKRGFYKWCKVRTGSEPSELLIKMEMRWNARDFRNFFPLFL